MEVDYLPGWQDSLLWIVVVAFLIAFALGFALGANDCANSYGPSVGSGVLKLWHAYLLASVFEVLGALLLGYKVTDTFRKNIVNVHIYDVNVYLNHSTNLSTRVDSCPASYSQQSLSLLDDNDSFTGHLDHGHFVEDTVFDPGFDCYTMTDISLAIGAVGILGGSAIWLIIATFFKLPVSTTHSAVGATIGFSLAARGATGIQWGMVGKIVFSWLASPVFAGLFSITFYLAIKAFALNKKDPIESSLKLLPWMFLFTVSVNIFSVTYKGSKYLGLDVLPWYIVLVISVAIGALVAFLVRVFAVRRIRKHVHNLMLAPTDTGKVMLDMSPPGGKKLSLLSGGAPASAASAANGAIHISPHVVAACNQLTSPDGQTTLTRPNIAERGILPQDFINPLLESQKTGDVGVIAPVAAFESEPNLVTNGAAAKCAAACGDEERGEDCDKLAGEDDEFYDDGSFKSQVVRVFQAQDENMVASRVYSSLQVLSSVFLSFSHGSNDTANAVGPLVALWVVYKSGYALTDSAKNDLAIQGLIVFGAAAMIIGLWCLGHKVIETVGSEITQITPASGFAMQIGTAFTVLFCSKIGIPVSTTHCLVGAVVAVGWVKSKAGSGHVSWKLFGGIGCAWLVTLPAAGALSALITYILITFL